jgi:hypothetical protein
MRGKWKKRCILSAFLLVNFGVDFGGEIGFGGKKELVVR